MKTIILIIIIFLSINSFSQNLSEKQTMIGIGTSNFSNKFAPNISVMYYNFYVDFGINLTPKEYEFKKYNYLTTNFGYNIKLMDNLSIIPTIGYFKKDIAYYKEMIQGQHQIDHSIIFGAILNVKLNESIYLYGGCSAGLKTNYNIEFAENLKIGILLRLKLKNETPIKNETKPIRKYYPIKNETKPIRKYYPIKN